MDFNDEENYMGDEEMTDDMDDEMSEDEDYGGDDDFDSDFDDEDEN